MKTSRMSRETARVVNALRPSRRAARSLQGSSNRSTSLSSESTSPLSASPTSSRAADTALSRKRKRGDLDLPVDAAATISVESTEVRRSPRKTVKFEDGAPLRKPKRQPARRINQDDGSTAVEPPANWEKVYNITAEMRKRVVAPVDTMGCESLAERDREPKDQRLQTLVSLMLSSQTKDTVTAVAMKNLQDNLPGGFCLESLLKVEPQELNELIGKVGFHNNKTKYIKSTALMLKDHYNGDIPQTIEGLVALPGVGPKMAYLCMSAAWGRDEGIGVDVHVHRITNLWGWHKTATPEQTRAELEAWLPKDKWHDINHLLVGFGQTICPPVGRRCDECDLSIEKLCPSAVAGSPKKKKVKQAVAVKDEDGAVKREEAVIEADGAATTLHMKSEDVGEVFMQTTVPDIEGLGAGHMRKMAEAAQVDL